MKYLNSIKKKISRKDLKFSVKNTSKLIAQFINGVLIQINEKYNYES